MSPVHQQAAAMPLPVLPKLTANDLDAAQLEREARPAIEPIKTVEQEHPWLWLVYGGVFLVALVVSALSARFPS